MELLAERFAQLAKTLGSTSSLAVGQLKKLEREVDDVLRTIWAERPLMLHRIRREDSRNGSVPGHMQYEGRGLRGAQCMRNERRAISQARGILRINHRPEMEARTDQRWRYRLTSQMHVQNIDIIKTPSMSRERSPVLVCGIRPPIFCSYQNPYDKTLHLKLNRCSFISLKEVVSAFLIVCFSS